MRHIRPKFSLQSYGVPLRSKYPDSEMLFQKQNISRDLQNMMRKLYFIDPDQKKFEFHFSIIRLPMEKKKFEVENSMTSRIEKRVECKKKIRSRDFKSRLREDADQLPITVCGFILIDCLQLEMAARWLPNTEEFFFSLARLIESSENSSIQLHMTTQNSCFDALTSTRERLQPY